MSNLAIGKLAIQCALGDITQQPDVEVIVNAANAELLPGGGVAGAIHRAAGPGLAAECGPLAPLEPGKAVLTGGHRLPNRYVIHCLGPVYGRDEPADELLRSCYQQALRLADDHRAASIAFPAISTGAFGYPMQAAAKVALGTIVAHAGSLRSLSLIRFVLHANADLAIHDAVLAELIRRRFPPAK